MRVQRPASTLNIFDYKLSIRDAAESADITCEGRSPPLFRRLVPRGRFLPFSPSAAPSAGAVDAEGEKWRDGD